MSGTNRDDFATLLRHALHTDGAPQRILHLISGIEQPDSPSGGAGEPHTRVARLVSLLFFEENRALEDVQTGNLLRLVVEGEHGAVYCLAIQRKRHLVGLLTGDGSPEAVDAADRVMVRLVDAVRSGIGLNSQNAAGLATEATEDEATGLPKERVDGRNAPVTMIHGSDTDPWLRDLLLGVVATDSLQWVALVRGREVRVAVDCFADGRMDDYFVLIGQDARRRFYTDLAGSGCLLMNRVSRIVRPVVGGPVRRVVLDVEEGTVVLHRLDAHEHLVGVTLDQERVATVERLLRRVAAAVSAVPAG